MSKQEEGQKEKEGGKKNVENEMNCTMLRSTTSQIKEKFIR